MNYATKAQYTPHVPCRHYKRADWYTHRQHKATLAANNKVNAIKS